MLLFALLVVGQTLAPFREVMDGAMLPDTAVYTFSHSDQLLPVRKVPRGGRVRSLVTSDRKLATLAIPSGGRVYDLYDYLSMNRVAGLLILKDGKVVREDYQLTATANTRWASFSLAKSITSTLIGAAIVDGHIKSLDDRVEQYVPELASGAYAKVTVRQLLQMASGVKWDETYTDPNSDRRKLLEIQLKREPGATLRFMNSLPRAAEAGRVWKYSTGETFVIGALLERATKRPLAQYLSEKLWSRLGVEQDAAWWTETQDGLGFGGSGVSATLRDYGRFGQFVLEGGKGVVPAGWFEEASRRQVLGGKPVEYGYLWWTIPSTDPIHTGAFRATGIFGQFIYVNPAERLVVVVLSARPKPVGINPVVDNEFFGAVAKALK